MAIFGIKPPSSASSSSSRRFSSEQTTLTHSTPPQISKTTRLPFLNRDNSAFIQYTNDLYEEVQHLHELKQHTLPKIFLRILLTGSLITTAILLIQHLQKISSCCHPMMGSIVLPTNSLYFTGFTLSSLLIGLLSLNALAYIYRLHLTSQEAGYTGIAKFLANIKLAIEFQQQTEIPSSICHHLDSGHTLTEYVDDLWSTLQAEDLGIYTEGMPAQHYPSRTALDSILPPLLQTLPKLSCSAQTKVAATQNLQDLQQKLSKRTWHRIPGFLCSDLLDCAWLLKRIPKWRREAKMLGP